MPSVERKDSDGLILFVPLVISVYVYDSEPIFNADVLFSVYTWHHHGKKSNKIKDRMVESLM